MSREKKGLRAMKIFLPVFVYFLLVILATRIINATYTSTNIKDDGAGDAELGVMIFCYVVLPLIFLILLLAQWLIVLPLWNKVVDRYKYYFWVSMGALAIFSFVSGIGLDFALVRNHLKLHTRLTSIFLTCLIQLSYWFVNIIILYFLDKRQMAQKRVVSIQ